MTAEKDKDSTFYCSFVSIHYIICECGETFPTENALKLHLEKEHPHKRERKEYKCGVCGSIFNTEEECIIHYEESHMKLEFHPDETVSDSELVDESQLKEEVYEEVPATEYHEAENFEEQHLQSLVTIPDGTTIQLSDIPLEQRDMLQVTSDGQLVFYIQGDNHLLEKKIRKKKSIRDKVKDRVCEVCGKYYASNAALRYHQRVHTGEKPYQCTLCPKSFTMPLFLQIHVRTHTGERPFPCALCPKRFSNRAALMRHDRVHTGEKPYPCPMCDKNFTQSNSMKLHVTTVHLKQPAPYKSRNRRLKAESRLHTQKNPQKSAKNSSNTTRNIDVIDGDEVIKHGLEKYVLGPLKNDIKHLKSERVESAKFEVGQPQSESENIKFEVVEYDEVIYENEG